MIVYSQPEQKDAGVHKVTRGGGTGKDERVLRQTSKPKYQLLDSFLATETDGCDRRAGASFFYGNPGPSAALATASRERPGGHPNRQKRRRRPPGSAEASPRPRRSAGRPAHVCPRTRAAKRPHKHAEERDAA